MALPFPKYKLVLFNEYTLRPVLTILGSRLKMIFLLVGSLILLLALGIVIGVYSPLQTWLKGQEPAVDQQQLNQLIEQIEWLEDELEAIALYTETIQNVLTQRVPDAESYMAETDPLVYESPAISGRIAEDSILRESLIRIDLRNPFSRRFQSTGSQSRTRGPEEMRFIRPVDGVISQLFFPELGHYGIDIVAPRNSAIKSIAEGVVIWSDWTVEGGNSLGILHPGGLVSIYKHNSQLLKKVGSFVDSGEVIAIIGNTGELTDGPHLHFEMWYQGEPLNPLDFFEFL